MEDLLQKCNELRKELTKWYKENVAPLKEENIQLKAKIKTLEAESQRYREIAQKLRRENNRLHDICEYQEEKPKYTMTRKGRK